MSLARWSAWQGERYPVAPPVFVKQGELDDDLTGPCVPELHEPELHVRVVDAGEVEVIQNDYALLEQAFQDSAVTEPISQVVRNFLLVVHVFEGCFASIQFFSLHLFVLTAGARELHPRIADKFHPCIAERVRKRG